MRWMCTQEEDAEWREGEPGGQQWQFELGGEAGVPGVLHDDSSSFGVLSSRSYWYMYRPTYMVAKS